MICDTFVTKSIQKLYLSDKRIKIITLDLCRPNN